MTLIDWDTVDDALAEVEDYNHFMALVDMDASLDIPAELALLKAHVLEELSDEAAEILDVEPTELVADDDIDEPEPKKVAVNAPEKITAVPVIPKSGTPITYHFNSDDIVQGGAKSKFKANIEAIKTLQKIEAENRYATPEEQSVLAGYVGWGGIPQAFTTDRAADNIGGNLGDAAPTGWEEEQQELRQLLSDDEYKAARASTLTSFYTPPEVTDGVFQALRQFGFEGGNILEPSMGVGNFFAKMPDDMRDGSKLYGVELDSISGRIAQLLNPEDRIQITGFEKTRFNNNSFDVVIGNVPFGDYKVSDKAYDKLGFKIQLYMILRYLSMYEINYIGDRRQQMIRGTTYKRKDGRWECRISLGSENGHKKYRSFYGTSREEAEYKMVLACQGSVNEPSSITEMTVKQLSMEWLCVVNCRIKESTAANYRMKIERHIVPYLGEFSSAMLKTKTVSEFVQQKLKDGLSARYVCDILTLLKSIYRYASREYHINNVIDGIIMPKRAKPEIRVMTESEQHKLAAYINCNKNVSTLGVALSLYTGMRIGELCALRWQDIDVEKRILTVSHTIQRIQDFSGSKRTRVIITEPKSQSSKRTIPVPDCLIPMLKELKSKADSYVLTGSSKPIEPRTMQYRFKRILDNVNLPSYRFHSLRHAFASGAIEIGFDVKTLSEILGHSSVQITLDRYVHSSFDHKRDCMNLLTLAS